MTKRPVEADYTSHVAYTRALEAYCDGLEQPAVEPVAEVVYLERGGNAGIATRIVEIDNPYRERLAAGTKLFTAPQAQQPVAESVGWIKTSDKYPPAGVRVFWFNPQTNQVGYDTWMGEDYKFNTEYWMHIPDIATQAQPDARATAIQECIDRLVKGGKPAEAQMLRHHFGVEK